MELKTIKEFHWLTKTVIILTVFVFVLIGVAYIAEKSGHSALAEHLLLLLLYLLYVLSYVFFGVLVIIGIVMALSWIRRTYLEKNSGSLSDTKLEVIDLKMEIKLLRQSIEAMQKKVDNIERILEKVSD